MFFWDTVYVRKAIYDNDKNIQPEGTWVELVAKIVNWKSLKT